MTEVKAPAMSLGARLLNVFAIPGDVFEEINTSPVKTGNWLVPALIAAIIGALTAIIIFSQPAILQKVREQQAQALDKQVKAGALTRAKADQLLVTMDKILTPTLIKVVGSVGATIGGFVRLFWLGLVLWLLGRWFLKAQFGYMKAVEIAGLASMISVLGMVVTMLLVINFGKLTSTPSLALAVSDFDTSNKKHLLLAAMNVFDFWMLGVLAAGLARLARVPFARAAFLMLGYWVIAGAVQILFTPKSFGF